MPRRPRRRMAAGTQINVGPLRVYVATNRDGQCATHVIFGTAGLGHPLSSVDEDVLIELQEAAENIVDFTQVEVCDGEPVDVPGETARLYESPERRILLGR